MRKSQMKARRAFTLIELLVVIAVIALLVSILMPSLSAAKAIAERTICLSHINIIGKGLHTYANEFDGWLAGPNTSGLDLSLNYNATDAIEDHYADRDLGPLEPTQAADWVSPTVGAEIGLPKNTVDRLVAIADAELKCPTNDLYYCGSNGSPSTATTFPNNSSTIGGRSVGSIRYMSYAAIAFFHWWEPPGSVPNASRYIQKYRAQMDAISFPTGHTPKLESIEQPASKVYVIEGARWTESGGGDHTISFSTGLGPSKGGAFMVQGPAMPRGHDPHHTEDGEIASDRYRECAWRHYDETINAVTFAGNAKTMTVEESLETDQYFPSGTVINNIKIGNNSTLKDPDLPPGPHTVR